ncbi:hypothetical protein SAMN05192588_1597 [Nonlabens sp. Hel1_33_55]|uniref:hypothetical protein n=1 Tax=Nonlabens sp. Hel1_33_55 TaxID=1336802 RepID=UPI000875A94B|nr:hypothetical protein [Nonlabens sp. Hel1_33_55]SCY19227.1 hypothetical protein SAMN05192588_1597 [Nonlabens sp. Hel1_33_55]
MKLYLPQNLDLFQLTSEHPIAVPNAVDKCAYICSLILMSKQYNKDRYEEEYVPLHSKKLQSVITEYKVCVDYLCDCGVIVVNHQYIVGERSKGYKFTVEYNTVAIPFTNLRKEFRNKLKRLEVNRNGYTDHLHYITKWLNNNLKINAELVEQYINLNYNLKTEFPDLQDYDNREKRFKCPDKQYKFSSLVLERMRNQDFSHGQDQNVYRLHTNLTNMPSLMRNALTYDGENLVSIDIKNSQPYLATLLLSNPFRLKRTTKPKTALQIDFGKKLQQTLKTFTPSENAGRNCASSSFQDNRVDNKEEILYKEIDNDNRININDIKLNDKSTYIMLLDQPVSPLNRDVIHYIELVTNGEFYEYLGKLFSAEITNDYSDRNKVKTEVLKLFFSSNRFISQPDAAAKRVFKKHFPTVYKVFSAVKKNNKADLAILLQSIESYLLLNVIAKRISREHPNAPIFSIHDSICTTLHYANAVKAIMEEELEKAIGIAPSLKPDYWMEESIHQQMRDLESRVHIAS